METISELVYGAISNYLPREGKYVHNLHIGVGPSCELIGVE